jgi:hypothetical protein
MRANTSGIDCCCDFPGPRVCREGLMAHIPVRHRYAAHYVRPNRLSCRFVEPWGLNVLSPANKKALQWRAICIWLGERDSNPRWRSQSPQSYH